MPLEVTHPTPHFEQSQERRRIFHCNNKGADRVPEVVVALHRLSPVSHVNTQYSQPENHECQANGGNGSLSAARSNPAAPGPRSQALSGAVGREITCSTCKGTGTVIYTSDIMPPDGAREPHTDRSVSVIIHCCSP